MRQTDKAEFIFGQPLSLPHPPCSPPLPSTLKNNQKENHYYFNNQFIYSIRMILSTPNFFRLKLPTHLQPLKNCSGIALFSSISYPHTHPLPPASSSTSPFPTSGPSDYDPSFSTRLGIRNGGYTSHVMTRLWHIQLIVGTLWISCTKVLSEYPNPALFKLHNPGLQFIHLMFFNPETQSALRDFLSRHLAPQLQHL